jgi:hypothetical protein
MTVDETRLNPGGETETFVHPPPETEFRATPNFVSPTFVSPETEKAGAT